MSDTKSPPNDSGLVAADDPIVVTPLDPASLDPPDVAKELAPPSLKTGGLISPATKADTDLQWARVRCPLTDAEKKDPANILLLSLERSQDSGLTWEHLASCVWQGDPNFAGKDGIPLPDPDIRCWRPDFKAGDLFRAAITHEKPLTSGAQFESASLKSP